MQYNKNQIKTPSMATYTGYQLKTTFWQDFNIAEAFGLVGIQDTYNRAYKEWKDDKEYATELVLVLNWKSWEHNEKYEKGIEDDKAMELYSKLYYELDGYILDNWNKDDIEYYLRTTD